MKRLFFSLALVAAFAVAPAQSNVKITMKAGMISSTVRGDAANSLSSLLSYSNGAFSSTPKMGFYAGLGAEIPLDQNLFVEPSLLYSQKGYQIAGNFGLKGLSSSLGVNAKAQLQLNYIDLPVLLKYRVSGLTIFGGPQMSYLTNANFNTKAGLLGINLLNSNMDVSSAFNKWDVGLTGGLGYDLGKNLNINAAYDYGLEKMDANRSVAAYNNAWRVGLTFRF